jgi:transcriptional regulator with XRE-family HTH domain
MPGRLQDADYAATVEVLVGARKHVGLTQVEVAARLGKPQSYVSKFENKERRIDIVEFVAIARALGCSPTELFGEVVIALGGAQSS